jgi:3D-(3,5/4)-trihydroxycyclohexane-1,2-dione acylhydrolase (decyclizing)
MGYEIAGGWGHAMAQSGPGGLGETPIVMVGDGTYLMMNSDIYSTVLTGHKMIVVVCDNGGYAVISRLQQFKGVPGFNNLLKDCRDHRQGQPLHVDFAKHAEVHGRRRPPLRQPGRPGSRAGLGQGQRPDDGDFSIVTDAHSWVPGDADWDVGVPEVSDRETVTKARESQIAIRAKQRVGV